MSGNECNPASGQPSRKMSRDAGQIVLTDVSKFYGEVLGVNKINLKISPGITSLVGPNGSGKGTRFLVPNLLNGLKEQSVIVVDPKGELVAITAAQRRANVTVRPSTSDSGSIPSAAGPSGVAAK